MDNIRDFLKSKFGKKNLVKTSDGELVTKDEKNQKDLQKAEAARRELESSERKVKKDIREALAFVNYSSSTNSTQNNSNTSSPKTKKTPTETHTHHSKTTPNGIDIDYNIDVPLMEEHARTPESDALDKHAREAASLLNDSTQYISTHRQSSQPRRNTKIVKNTNPQRTASGYDIDR